MRESDVDAAVNLPGIPTARAADGVPNVEMEPDVLEARGAFDREAGKLREVVRERLELLAKLNLAPDASEVQLAAREQNNREHGGECNSPRRIRQLWAKEQELRPRVQAAADRVHAVVGAARLALQPAAVASVYTPAARGVVVAFKQLLAAKVSEADARRVLEAAGFTAPAPLLDGPVFALVAGQNPTARELVERGLLDAADLAAVAPGVQL